jgi:4'-phosphopantetheinyl transferase
VLAPDLSWPEPPARIILAADEVHIWRVSLAITPEQEASWTAALAADERARASRFLALPARTQFVAARSSLRAILSRYLDCRPAEVVFRLGPVGKPALESANSRPLYFNLSHSRALALVAITRLGEIGVDVEQVREMPSRDALAERFFHPNEVTTLQRLNPDQRAAGFFNAWTRKEAFLKATGKGISYGIDRVEVTLRPGEEPRVLGVVVVAGASAGLRRRGGDAGSLGSPDACFVFRSVVEQKLQGHIRSIANVDAVIVPIRQRLPFEEEAVERVSAR